MIDLILSHSTLVAIVIVALAWGAVDAVAAVRAQPRAIPVRVRRR